MERSRNARQSNPPRPRCFARDKPRRNHLFRPAERGAYDALGRRIWKKFKKTITNFAWDGNVPLHEWKTFDFKEGSADDLITWFFESGGFVPCSKLKGDKQYSICADHLGTPSRVYDAEGALVWHMELDSYGRERVLKGDLGACPFRYQGQYMDAETGLYYNRFRYFDPEDGRYVSQDPIGLLSNEFSLYNYVKDSLGWIDHFGLANNSYGQSSKKYGHARSEHGAQRKEQALRDRANTKGQDQGHFQDNKMIEEAFSKVPMKPGVYDVKVSSPGKVYHPGGGTTTTNTVRVVIGEDKGVPSPTTAYPVIP